LVFAGFRCVWWVSGAFWWRFGLFVVGVDSGLGDFGVLALVL